MSGKRYPEEFKTEAVKQVVDRGYSVASVATRLDITTHSLYAWIKKYGPDSSTNKEQSDAQAEIRRLKIYSHMVTFWGNYEGISQGGAPVSHHQATVRLRESQIQGAAEKR